MEKLYTCEQVAKRYSVKPNTVWSWVRDRKLPAIKIGTRYRISEQALAAFESSNSTETNQKGA